MKALCSPTLSGSRAAEDLANRALAMYARVAGKSKVEAQLDYLECLRTWCPFYGSTFYDVQCQYDDNPLDANSTPPVISMNACIGPLAIFLITPTEPPVIMRHPYKRIIKWVTHPDKHIFTYWVIKPNISISDMEEYQEEHRGGDVDTRQFCDCVYLVTSQVRELEHLVKTYIEAVTDIPPSLPGATDELLPPKRVFDQILASEENSNNNSNQATQPEKIHEASDDDVEDRPAPQERKPVKSRLSVFFNALGGFDSPANNASNVTSGSGLANHEAVGGDEIYGDDTAGVNNSFFKGAYGRGSMVVEGNPDGDEDASINKIPNNVKYAASMSELKRLAEETEFSDHDDEDDDEDESEDDDDDSGKGGKSHPRGKGVKGNSEEDIPTQKLGGGVPSMTAFRRASRILFGGFQQQQPFSGKKPDGDEEGSESSSGAGSDDDGDSGDGAPRGNSSDDED